MTEMGNNLLDMSFVKEEQKQWKANKTLLYKVILL